MLRRADESERRSARVIGPAELPADDDVDRHPDGPNRRVAELFGTEPGEIDAGQFNLSSIGGQIGADEARPAPIVMCLVRCVFVFVEAEVEAAAAGRRRESSQSRQG
jgi:hypothetical protein